MSNQEPSIEDMVRELREAGWKPHRSSYTIWIAPNGGWYLGPYGAWKAMKNGVEGVRS